MPTAVATRIALDTTQQLTKAVELFNDLLRRLAIKTTRVHPHLAFRILQAQLDESELFHIKTNPLQMKAALEHKLWTLFGTHPDAALFQYIPLAVRRHYYDSVLRPMMYMKMIPGDYTRYDILMRKGVMSVWHWQELFFVMLNEVGQKL